MSNAALVVFDRGPYARRDSCVNCMQPQAVHDAGKHPDYCYGFATMNLPQGKTCGDCVHIRRCNAMFGHMASDERCDWYPSRFRERTA
jgi:hypothetical protein